LIDNSSDDEEMSGNQKVKAFVIVNKYDALYESNTDNSYESDSDKSFEYGDEDEDD
jgi:hypothetical protein